MKVIEYRLDSVAPFLKGFLNIGVHVAGNYFHMLHPFKTYVLDEIVYHMFLFPTGNLEDVSCLHVDDVSRIAVTVMKLKFINAKEFSILLRFH